MTELTHFHIAANDLYPLAASCYRPSPEQDRKIVLQINSATAVPRSYYRAYAEYMADNGITVVTYDYRGINESVGHGLEKFPISYIEWAKNDQPAVVRWIDAHFPNHRHFVIGHSVGGQIFGLLPDFARIEGLYGVAAQQGYWRNWDMPWRLVVLFFWGVFLPAMTKLFGYYPGAMMGAGDLPAGAAYSWRRWGLHPEYFVGDQGEPLHLEHQRFKGKVLLNAFEDDPLYGPIRAIKRLAGLYSGASTKLRVISPQAAGVKKIGHFGFFRKSMKSSLWADSLNWLEHGVARDFGGEVVGVDDQTMVTASAPVK